MFINLNGILATRRYECVGDESVALAAGSLGTRYGRDALAGVLRDVVALSKADFIVCTFSSQVCRLAYELMQRRNLTDPADRQDNDRQFHKYNKFFLKKTIVFTI